MPAFLHCLLISSTPFTTTHHPPESSPTARSLSSSTSPHSTTSPSPSFNADRPHRCCWSRGAGHVTCCITPPSALRLTSVRSAPLVVNITGPTEAADTDEGRRGIKFAKARDHLLHCVSVCEFTRPCEGVDDCPHDNRRHSVLQHEFGQLAAAGHSGTDVQVSESLRCSSHSTSYAWRYRRALHEDGGATFAPGTGYDGGCAQGVFSVGLQGVGEEDVPLRLATIDQVLARNVVVGSVTESV
jgi:hypothetical protein